MNKTNQITSLAIDAMTQFRTGVEKVKVGNKIITAEAAFDLARKGLSTDERNIIIAIETMIGFGIKPKFFKNLNSLSVEVVA